MHVHWTIQLFAGLRAEGEGRVVTRFPTQKTGVLLAFLAYHLHRSHPRDTLIELLWPELAPPSARNSLSKALSFLRRELEPPGIPAGTVLLANHAAVQLNPAIIATDVSAFEAALQTAPRSSDRAARLASLSEAVELYRGELLPDYCESWVLEQREYLAESYFQALGELVALLEQDGELQRALAYARRGVLLDGLREEPRRDLIRLYAAAGQPAAALRQYRELAQRLNDELDAKPSMEIQALAAEIEAGQKHAPLVPPLIVPGHSETVPSLVPHEAVRHNLPTPLTSFVGRKREMAAVRRLLTGRLLLTLTGAAGSGKTRLALEAVATLRGHFPDGIWFVELAPIRDPDLVAATITRTLSLPEVAGRSLREGLRDYLREKNLLLVLDNFEQVLPAAALVPELLAAAPRLAILITSRARLRVRGEREFPVPPLELPDRKRVPSLAALTQSSAVQLFIQRAVDVQPEFRVTNQSAPAVAEICHRLDGLPLALELAAARVRLLPPQALLSRLESRLKLLTGGARDLPARQQTLRNAIAWSHDLLGEAEKTLFRRLAVFVGGCTLEAAEAVCNGGTRAAGPGDLAVEVLDGIASLGEQSLLRQGEGPGGEPRFSMLETILEYGCERLAESGEEEAIRRQHAHFFVTQAEVTQPQQYGPESVAWKERWGAELNNLRAVLIWAEEHREAAIGLRLLVALRWFWIDQLHGRLAYEALTRLLALPEAAERNSLRGWALVVAAHLRDDVMADYEGACQLFEESRAIGQEVGDRRLVAHSLTFQGFMTSGHGEQRTAERLWDQGLSIAREVNDRSLIAGLLSPLAWRAAKHGDLRKARAYLEERLAIVQEIGHREVIANTLIGLGNLAREEGDPAGARALYEQSLAFHRETGFAFNIVRPLHALGDLALNEGDLEAALALHAESLALRKEVNIKREIPASLARLGRVAEVMGNEEKARALYTESLHLCQEMGNREGIAGCLEGLARLQILEGEPERAARLFGAAAALREAADALLSPRERKEVEPGMTAVRTALSSAAFEAAWAEGQAMPLEQMIEDALERGARGA